ncbi:uncharacterized protein LOC127856171 isoform X2 [Dreissena polymorpha]|nr:uncharacterized protein LOC127856171 isoform X2 [Dreissena polymorpha]
MIIFVVTFSCLCACAMSLLTCTDWQGRPIPDGEDFYPYKDDPCHMCRCYQGESTMCKAVSCSPPKCPKWREISKKCCHYECLDVDGSSYTPDNNTEHRGNSVNGDGTPTEAGTVTDLGLRLVASTITTFLILALLLFLIHRFRQRRLLMTLRRYGRRREHLDDSDNISYTPDFFGVQCPPYEDPPPPYTPPKPQPGEQPPPYEALDTDNTPTTGDADRYTDNNSANSSHGNFPARGANSSNSSGECLISRGSNSNSDNGGHIITRGVNTGLNESSMRDDGIDGSVIGCGNQQVSRAIQAVGNCSNRVRHTRRGAQDSQGNRASVHFKNSPTGQPTITMGIQDRQLRNRCSGIRLSNQSSPVRNSMNDRTMALNLELKNVVHNIRNRSWCEVPQGDRVTQNDHSSSTDIGESTTSAESLTSSPESPENAAEFHISSSPEALSHDADSTVKRFLDQFGPVSRGRRYPTTMSQSWTSNQVPPVSSKHVKQSISIGAFPQESDSVGQSPQQGGSSQMDIRPLLPRSKSEHLKTNGSLINHPFNGVVKSTGSVKPSSFQPHGNGVRVAYKERDELSSSQSPSLTFNQNPTKRSSLSFTKNLSCQDDYIRSDVSECGSLMSNVSNLAAAILDPGDIIVTKRQDELRKLRLSHLLSDPLFCPGSSTGNQGSDFSRPDTRQLYRSFSENSVDVSSVSASSETFEKGVQGSTLRNDSKYPSNSYKNLLQTCLSAQPLRPAVMKKPERFVAGNNSENPVISTTGKKKDNKPMVNSWHAGMCESDDENMSVSTLARNSNQHFEKNLCRDKDVANIFLPLFKLSNAEKYNSEDNTDVPNSEMRACASQMFACEMGDFQREKNHRGKQLLKQYSSGCIFGKHDEVSANNRRKMAKKSNIDSDLTYLGSSDSQAINRRLSCPEPKPVVCNSSSGMKDPSRPYLMHSAIPTNVALLDHNIPALLQLRNTDGRPRNDKRRSKSVGRSDTTRTSGRKTVGYSASRARSRKKNSPQQTCSYHRELENVLENKKSGVKHRNASNHQQSYSEFSKTNCAISQV